MEENMASPEVQQPNPEALKSTPEIAIATATFYPQWYPGEVKGELTPDKLRGDLALQSLDAAKINGFRVALVDGGSSQAFLDTLKLKGVNFEAQKEQGGQGPARRQGLQMVENIPGIKVIATTEPEKVSIIADCLKIASEPVLKGEADIVIPKRTEKSMETYPAHQAKQEKKSNKIYNAILRSRGLLKKDDPDLDFWGGTRVYANRPEVRDLFKLKREFKPGNTELDKKVRMEMYSNPLFHPIVDALYKGLKVKSVEVPYVHPAKQTYLEAGNKEFDQKRHTQRRTIVSELVHLIRLKERAKNPKKKSQIVDLTQNST